MTRISTQPGDIVVVVPRWIIVAVGLLMLLMGLTGSFLFLFVGLVTEGVFLSLFVFVLVPFQLLITYIVWRFYWYFLVLGILIPSLFACMVLTGFARVGANTYAFARNAATGAPIFPLGDQLALVVLFAFGLALIVVLVLALFLKAIIGSPFPVLRNDSYNIDAPPPQRQRKRSGPRDLWKDDRPYPPPTDPYWDDK